VADGRLAFVEDDAGGRGNRSSRTANRCLKSAKRAGSGPAARARCAPKVPQTTRPVAVSSIADGISNTRSIACSGGDLARPGSGPADRGAAAAVRGAARRRPGHHPRGGRQGRAVCSRRRDQDLEPDAAGTPAPARSVRPAARRLPRPPTNQVRRRIGTAGARWPLPQLGVCSVGDPGRQRTSRRCDGPS
jgi:hypothetical protein